MSSPSSDEEDVLAYYKYRANRKVVTREYWCRPMIQETLYSGHSIAADQLKLSDRKFVDLYRMSKDSYQELVRMVAPSIRKVNTNMRECVTAEERVLITLRYLASGCSYVKISEYFLRGETTVGSIIKETIPTIWEVLRETYMPTPTEDEWREKAERFETLWNLPNCLGALAVKQIRIDKSPKTGYDNAILLLMCCDADGYFSMIESDFTGRIPLEMCDFGIPSPSPLPNDETDSAFPYYFICDDNFSLSHNFMKPYPENSFGYEKRIFNYRLSRGAKTVESVFGMAAEKFIMLDRNIRCRNRETLNAIIKASCVLHNFVHKREGKRDLPEGAGELNENETVETDQQIVVNEDSSPDTVRDYLANYFLSPLASIPSQWEYTVEEIFE